jgi:hypothetical protein
MSRTTPTIALAAALALAACGEPKVQSAPAPEKVATAVPAAVAPADAAVTIPDEIRAKLPAGAALNAIVSGRGTVVPPGEGGESHQRHAYDLPAGAAGVVAVVRWDDPSWPDVEIAIGIGLCPHRGRKLESAKSSTGAAAIHHAVSADEALVEDRWFLHVNGDAGLAAKPGKTLPYSYTVYGY